MNRQTWNWCEIDIAGFNKIIIFFHDPHSYYICDFCKKEYKCEKNDSPFGIFYIGCLSKHYPAKRDTYNYNSWDGTVEIFNSPDPYEIPELDDIVHTNINPQGGKHDNENKN